MDVPPTVYTAYRDYFYPLISGTAIEDHIHDNLVRLSQMGLEKVDGSNAEGIYEKDWDNLIILDACRYDYYQENMGNYIDHRITQGSNSRDFMKETFSERDCSDTVYISGNAHTDPEVFEEITGKKPREVFCEIFQTHETDWVDEEGADIQALIRDAKTADKLWSDKKTVIHLMQPHLPFLAQEEDKEIDYQKAKKGDISQERVRNAYERNLEYVLDDVLPEILEFLDGKTVITADHGEFLGENNRYGHPGGCREVILRKVPWHVIE